MEAERNPDDDFDTILTIEELTVSRMRSGRGFLLEFEDGSEQELGKEESLLVCRAIYNSLKPQPAVYAGRPWELLAVVHKQLSSLIGTLDECRRRGSGPEQTEAVILQGAIVSNAVSALVERVLNYGE